MTRRHIPLLLCAFLFVCSFGFPVSYADLNYTYEERAQVEQAVKDKKWDVVREMVTKSPDLAKCWMSDYLTILHAAVLDGQMDMVKFLLEKGADVDARDEKQRTALMFAAQTGNEAVLKVLIANGADVKARDKSDMDALLYASAKGDVGPIEALLDAGADLETCDIYGRDVLYYAVKSGKVDAVALFLQKGVKIERPVKPKEPLRPHLMSVAIEYGHANVVDLLIKHGVDPGSKIAVLGGLEYPIIIAIRQGQAEVLKVLLANGAGAVVRFDYALGQAFRASEPNLEVVKLLVENGADVNSPKSRFSPLFLALRKQLHDVAKFLIEKGAAINTTGLQRRFQPLHAAVLNNDREMVELVLAKGAKILNGPDPIYLADALMRDDLRLAEMLVGKGADVNAQDRAGRSVLQIMAQRRRIGAVKFLLSKGAKVNHVDICGRTALDIALQDEAVDEGIVSVLRAEGGKASPPPKYSEEEKNALFLALNDQDAAKSIELIGKNPALANCRNDVLATPLHRATKPQMIEVVKALIAAGADVNAITETGWTPLHGIASEPGGEEIAGMLLDAGADIDARNINDETPLMVALSWSREEAAIVLIKRGAGIGVVETENGETPLHLAGNLEIVKMLIAKGADTKVKDYWGRTPMRAILDRIEQPGVAEVARFYYDRGLRTDDALLNAILDDDAGTATKLLKETDEKSLATSPIQLARVAVALNRAAALKAFLAEAGKFEIFLKDGLLATNILNMLLLRAVRAGALDAVDVLVGNGADLTMGGQPRTLLFEAGSTEMARFLIEKHGMDVNLTYDVNMSLLLYEILRNDRERMELYIFKGADLKFRDSRRRTLLHRACMSRGVEKKTIEILLDKGAQINATNRRGVTPLHYACQHHGLDIVKMLVARGGDVKANDNDGATTLHYAAYSGDMAIVRFLVDQGLDVKAKTRMGETLLHRAVVSGDIEMVKFLLEKGVDINARFKEQTALEIAEKRGDEAIANLLKEHGAK